MRKDFVVQDDSSEDEAAFVERYWTEKWDALGGPGDTVARITRREDYRAMAPYLDRLPSGAQLLDGGCGLGEFVVHLTHRGLPTLGLDISRKTVEALSVRFPEARFEVGDIRATGLPDASIDGYFSWGTFEHFEAGLEPCILEALRILKPGGYLFITVPFDNLRHALRAAADRVGNAAPGATQTRFYQWRLTRGELRQTLARCGFDVIEVRPIGKRQGVLRSLQHEFGLPHDWRLSRAFSAALAPLLPGGLIAHMLFAAARKPAELADMMPAT